MTVEHKTYALGAALERDRIVRLIESVIARDEKMVAMLRSRGLGDTPHTDAMHAGYLELIDMIRARP